MLEADSSRQLFEPSLSEKTDSVFYANGILQAMQQLADQYYFQNELRGDLVTTTDKATTDLRNMSTFDADVTNKYDSVYLYYKVINNCNYYLKNRKTDLINGNEYVAIREYIAVASIRSWAYLQLVRNYGAVPYVTEPVTSISQINAQANPTDAQTIIKSEAEYLANLKNSWSPEYWRVPESRENFSIGSTNWGQDKRISFSKCFIPINIILGDLYLESSQYEQAAKAYYDYIYYTALNGTANIRLNYLQIRGDYVKGSSTSKTVDVSMYPSDCTIGSASVSGLNQTITYLGQRAYTDWDDIYATSYAPGDVITYIPMAVSATKGQVTNIPEAYGYLYYEKTGTRIADYSINTRESETPDVQIIPTTDFQETYKNAPFYYIQDKLSATQKDWNYSSANIGDARFNFISTGGSTYPEAIYVQKPSNGYIYLYRTSTVFLHLAEALNRMGYPDAAFAVLKDGLNSKLQNYTQAKYEAQAEAAATARTYDQSCFYISDKTIELLSTVLPFITETTVFEEGIYSVGIHMHGGGVIAGLESPYQYSTEVQKKLDELTEKFGLDLTNCTEQDTINAIEDILCDEYALEFAFEGTRFSDLQRIARHKNESGLYGGNFGDIWLTEKLKGKGKNITTQNCFLPFK